MKLDKARKLVALYEKKVDIEAFVSSWFDGWWSSYKLKCGSSTIEIDRELAKQLLDAKLTAIKKEIAELESSP